MLNYARPSFDTNPPFNQNALVGGFRHLMVGDDPRLQSKKNREKTDTMARNAPKQLSVQTRDRQAPKPSKPSRPKAKVVK